MNENNQLQLDNIKLTNFNKLQIALSLIYLFGILMLLAMIYKVYKFYHIVWHFPKLIEQILYWINKVRHKDVIVEGIRNEMMHHINYVYYNMYSTKLTIHIIEQFFGPMANIMFDLLGLNNQDSWDFDAVPNDKGGVGLSLFRNEFPTQLLKVPDASIGISVINKDKSSTVDKQTVLAVQRLQLKSQNEKSQVWKDEASQSSSEAICQLLGFDKSIFDFV